MLICICDGKQLKKFIKIQKNIHCFTIKYTVQKNGFIHTQKIENMYLPCLLICKHKTELLKSFKI